MNVPSSATVTFVPLNPGAEAALPLCVAVVDKDGRRTVPVIRTTWMATAYLGAVCDHRGGLQMWVELWLPHADPAPGSSSAGGSHSPLGADAHWRDMIFRWEKSDASGFVKSGWEAALPRPLILDLASLTWTAPAEADASAAPKPSARATLAPASPGGGMAVRRIAPLGIGEYADVLAGTPLASETAQQEIVRFALGRPGAQGSAGASAAAVPEVEFLSTPHRFLMRSRAGRREWLAEVMAIKMRLVCLALRQTRQAIAQLREPFLGLSEFSYAVRFGPGGPPVQLWDFEVLLHAAGCAAVRPGGGTPIAWRIVRESQMPPAYERRTITHRTEREVEARLRLVTRQGAQTLIEATLGRCEETNLAGSLACLHLPLQTGRRMVWGRVSRDNSLSRDEARFRSFLTEFEEPVIAELERMQGFVWTSVFVEILPAAGYGDDFHSLGVLATRLLLTPEPKQLPAALDAVFSVIERLRETSGDGGLAAQLKNVFDREPRFRELLHPGRGVAFQMSREDSIDALGESNWWELLAWIVRLFPTELPTAFCRWEQATDLGVFPKAFDDAIDAAEAMSRRLTDQVLPPESMNGRIRAITEAIRKASGIGA